MRRHESCDEDVAEDDEETSSTTTTFRSFARDWPSWHECCYLKDRLRVYNSSWDITELRSPDVHQESDT